MSCLGLKEQIGTETAGLSLFVLHPRLFQDRRSEALSISWSCWSLVGVSGSPFSSGNDQQVVPQPLGSPQTDGWCGGHSVWRHSLNGLLVTMAMGSDFVWLAQPACRLFRSTASIFMGRKQLSIQEIDFNLFTSCSEAVPPKNSQIITFLFS